MPSRAGEIFKRFGFNMEQKLPVDQRIELQVAILNAHLADIAAMNGSPFVSDRSTLDFAAYLTLHTMHDATTEERQIVEKYVQDCLKIATWKYYGVVLVQPGIPYEEAEGKPKNNALIQEAFNGLCMSYMRDKKLDCGAYMFERHLTDLDTRMESSLAIWNMLLHDLKPEKSVTH